MRPQLKKTIQELTIFIKSNFAKFAIKFGILSALFYYFNIMIIGLASNDGMLYSPIVANYFNYIEGLRNLILLGTKYFLEFFSYDIFLASPIIKLIAVKSATISLNQSCIGFGVMGVWLALIISYPIKFSSKLLYLLLGLIGILVLNILRISALLVVLSSNLGEFVHKLDHHFLFNIILYIIVILMMMKLMKSNPIET